LFSAGAIVSGNRLAKNAWDGMFVFESPGTASSAMHSMEREPGHRGELRVRRGPAAHNHAGKTQATGWWSEPSSGRRIEDNTLTRNGDSGVFMFDLLNSPGERQQAGGNVWASTWTAARSFTGQRIANQRHEPQPHRASGSPTTHQEQSPWENIPTPTKGFRRSGGIILFAVTGNTVRGTWRNGTST